MVDRQLLAEKRAAIFKLAERYGVYDVRVFGSVARGDSNERSDIDLLVKVRPGRSLFDVGGFLMDVQDLLGCKVDVLTDDSLKPRIRERVLREAVAV
jgi:predicted nucleotidyltransferase